MPTLRQPSETSRATSPMTTDQAISRLPAVLAGLLLLSLGGCGADEPKADQPPSDSRAGPRPMAFDQVEATSLMALPGGMLTELMPSKTKREAGARLAADDPLHAAFLVRADERFAALTWHGENIQQLGAKDPALARLWAEARRAPRVSDWRPNPEGGLHVVVELDMAPLYQHLRRAEKTGQ